MCNYVAYNRFYKLRFFTLIFAVFLLDVINPTNFGNDWPREYKVMEGRILACSVGMACRL